MIGSDILYERRFAEPLSERMLSLLAPGGQVFMADPGRPYLQSFVDAMKKRGMDCHTEIVPIDDAHFPKAKAVHEIFLLSFHAP